MKFRFFPIVAATLVLIAFTGCNTFTKQPKITSAVIEPQVLKPGDSAVISIAIKDKHQIITRVEGVVLEDPRLTFKLRDDGEAPDKKAKDGVWSMQVDVPFQAPPGEFKLEFTAYDKEGTAISVRDERDRVIPLQQVIPLKIEYPTQ